MVMLYIQVVSGRVVLQHVMLFQHAQIYPQHKVKQIVILKRVNAFTIMENVFLKLHLVLLPSLQVFLHLLKKLNFVWLTLKQALAHIANLRMMELRVKLGVTLIVDSLFLQLLGMELPLLVLHIAKIIQQRIRKPIVS